MDLKITAYNSIKNQRPSWKNELTRKIIGTEFIEKKAKLALIDVAFYFGKMSFHQHSESDRPITQSLDYSFDKAAKALSFLPEVQNIKDLNKLQTYIYDLYTHVMSGNDNDLAVNYMASESLVVDTDTHDSNKSVDRWVIEDLAKRIQRGTTEA